MDLEQYETTKSNKIVGNEIQHNKLDMQHQAFEIVGNEIRNNKWICNNMK